jgi:peroxiredoxin
MTLLAPGDSFPTLTLTQVGGDPVALPDVFDGGYGVVLFYRGSWCPYCSAQLRAFQRAKDRAGRGGRGRRHTTHSCALG